MHKLIQVFPQCTMWLMTDQVNEEAGQISPEIEQAQKALK